MKQICERVAVLSQGKIVEEGEVKEIFTRPKHQATKHLVHLSGEDLPSEWLKNRREGARLIRLGFEGDQANRPIISLLAKHYRIDVNIISGGLDHVQQTTIGHLFVRTNRRRAGNRARIGISTTRTCQLRGHQVNPETLQIIEKLLPIELWNTIYMVLASGVVAILIGLPLGIILTITDKGHLKPHATIHQMLGAIINIGRSFPFAILMIALIPLTRWIAGTSLGTTASIVPLSIAAIPFAARLVEASLKEVDKGMVEAALVMGSTPFQIILKVLIPESLPSLILGGTTMMINLIGYSAMAGTMGGGGLGKIAIQYGYQRFNVPIMIITVILLIILVQAVQQLGHGLTRRILHKRGKSRHS